MDKLKEKREQECIEKYKKKLTVVNKTKRAGLITAAIVILLGLGGTGGYFAYKAMTQKPGEIVVAEEFIVEFDSDGGSEFAAKKFEKGKEIDLTQFAPKKDGYVFQGWFFDKEFQNRCPTKFKIEQNLKIYAKWEVAIADKGLGYILNSDGNSYSVYMVNESEAITSNGILTLPSTYNNKPITSIGFYNEETGISIGFQNCTKLKQLHLNNFKDNNFIINNSAFKNCVLLTRIEMYSTKLTSIKSHAFENCFTLQSIPNGISNLTEIGDYAFANDYVLSNADMNSSSVTHLGKGAFKNCYSLININLNRLSLINIPESCFENCQSLNVLLLSATTAKIEINAFKNCILNNVQVLDRYSTWSDDLGNIYTYNQIGKELIKGTSLYKGAFEDESGNFKFYIIGDNACSVADSDKRTDTKISIPSQIKINESITMNVTRIAEKAYYDKRNLSEVTIPSSIQSIGKSAFSMCMELNKVTFADESNSVLTKIEEDAFRSTKISTITLPDSLTNIGDNAFCFTKIKTINIPASVQTIDDSSIEFTNPSTGDKVVTVIGPFYGCHELEEITVSGNNVGGYYTEDGVLYKKVLGTTTLIRVPEAYKANNNTFIPAEDTITIGYGSLYGVSNIENVIVNSKCVYIYQLAFSCDSGTTNNIKNISFEDNSNLEYVNSYAFNKTNISSIVLPSSTYSIDDLAFSECKKLTSFTIPANVEYIENAICCGSGIKSYSETSITFEDTTSSWQITNAVTSEIVEESLVPVDESGKTKSQAICYILGSVKGNFVWRKNS